MQRKQFIRSLEAMPKTDQELKDIEERHKLMANRGHWIVTPDGKKKRIDK
ncbi:MAG: hypothetical protein K2Y22_04370 [Candidatus Obscuribacterales bacterium]|nr:hypothetical protein [Candidatus Obscuribacterales bacterium]